MKKLIVALMIFLFLNFSFNLAYASFLTSAITNLQPAMAVAGSAGSKIVPAVFTGTAAGGNVSSWISLAIPGGAIGKIVGAALGIAGALAIDYVFNHAPDWFASHSLAMLGGILVDKGLVTYPLGSDHDLYAPVGGYGGMYAAAAAASTVCGQASMAAAQGNLYLGGGLYAQVSQCVGPSSDANVNWYQWGYYTPVVGGGSWVYYKYFFPKYAIVQDPAVPANNPVIPATAQALLTTDLAANNANAVKVGQAGLEVAAAALENPSHPLNLIPAIKDAYHAALKEGVTAQQLTDLEAQVVPATTVPVPVARTDPITYLTPAQIAAAVQQALAGQGLSAAQIALAISAAQAGAGSGGLTQAQSQAATAAALTGAGLIPAQIAIAIRAANPAATAQEIATAIKVTIPPITPTDLAIAIKTANPTLTAEQVKTAVQEGVTAAKAAEPVVPPLGGYAGEAVPAAWHTPAVGNFSTLFSNFLLAMKSTPLFSLPGLLSSSVPSGGECTMSINMGTRFGGAQDFSICNWATGLSAMKAALLCMASIFAVGIVVKGGGG